MNTLRESLEFYDPDGGLLRQLRRERPRDYEDFIDVLYFDLDQLIGLMEERAADLGSSSEDFLNRELVSLLNARCYIASHDHDEGGHVDIHVRSGNSAYSWLGEAKLDNGPAYILSGLHQLIDRYARGTPGHNCGGVLVYFQKARCSERFKEWRQRLEVDEASNFEGLSISECARRPGLAFYSEFILTRIGSEAPKYKARHIAVSLFRTANSASDASIATTSSALAS